METLKNIQQKIIDIRNQRRIMKMKINNFLPNINSYTSNDYYNIKLKEKDLKKTEHKMKLRVKKYKRLNEINKSNI